MMKKISLYFILILSSKCFGQDSLYYRPIYDYEIQTIRIFPDTVHTFSQFFNNRDQLVAEENYDVRNHTLRDSEKFNYENNRICLDYNYFDGKLKKTSTITYHNNSRYLTYIQGETIGYYNTTYKDSLFTKPIFNEYLESYGKQAVTQIWNYYYVYNNNDSLTAEFFNEDDGFNGITYQYFNINDSTSLKEISEINFEDVANIKEYTVKSQNEKMVVDTICYMKNCVFYVTKKYYNQHFILYREEVYGSVYIPDMVQRENEQTIFPSTNPNEIYIYVRK
jgi:hypothetical protein